MLLVKTHVGGARQQLNNILKENTLTTINVPSYWPYWTTDEVRKFYFTSADGSLAPEIITFSYDPQTQSMCYKDYDENMVWKDTWFLRNKKGFGLAEWRDDYPQTDSTLKTLFGPIRSLVFSTPIGWGTENQTLPSTFYNKPQVSFFESTPPQVGSCQQWVVFEQLLPTFANRYGAYQDVLVFTYQQKWGSTQTGARYWMAKGVGPVSIVWIGVSPTGSIIQSVQLDAQITSSVNIVS